MAMATSVNDGKFIISLFFFALLFGSGARCKSVPGIYMFGDSLVDVGNNNYLYDTMLKANFPHNGVDFPSGNATGRFSNGKNTADYLAEKVGLPTAPPYLSLVNELVSTNVAITGVSFASGGAGILSTTSELFVSIPLTQQVEYYSIVYDQLVQQMGSSGARTHLARSLFVIVVGSNDLFAYFTTNSLVSNQYTAQQYVHLMASTLKQLIKSLYGMGARKFVVTGVGMIGCCPVQRLQMNTSTNESNEDINYWSTKYNIRLKILLKNLKLQLSDMNYSYFDAYHAMNDLIQNPQNYGISEINEACCGLGNLNAQIPCIPASTYCSNRSDHLFWDLVHPTEAVSHMFSDILYNGSQKFTLPINVKHLVDI